MRSLGVLLCLVNLMCARKRNFGKIFRGFVEMPGIAHQKDGCAVIVRGQIGAVGIFKTFPLGFVGARNPARGKILRWFKHDRQAEFIFDSVSHYFKLQHADHADNPFGSDYRLENTGASFFGNLSISKAPAQRPEYP